MSRPTQVALLCTELCRYRAFTVCGRVFQRLPVLFRASPESSYNPARAVTHTVWALSLSIATTQEIDTFFLFLRVLRCFSSPGSLQIALVPSLQLGGLPHSDICGSIPVCSYPQLFAAYHVLLRLRKPRHPPFALVTFLLNELHLAKYNFLRLHLSKLSRLP